MVRQTTDADKPQPIDTPEHRESLERRKRDGASGPHIDPFTAVPVDFNDRMKVFWESLEFREKQIAEREKAMQTPVPVKKVFDWTFNPQFFLTAGMAVAGVVASLIVFSFTQSQKIDKLADSVQIVQEQVRLNKMEADKRAETYVPIVQNQRTDLTLLTNAVQTMREANTDFRKYVQDMMVENNRALTKVTEALSTLTTEISVEKAKQQAIENAARDGRDSTRDARGK